MSGSKNNCGKSTYNPHLETSLQTACLQCPANSVTNDTAATSPQHCTCIAGYYNMRLANETVECCQCPVGSNCAAEGITLATLPLITGYYRSSNSSSDLRRCLDFGESSGCVGGASDGEGPCKLGLEAPPPAQYTAHACMYIAALALSASRPYNNPHASWPAHHTRSACTNRSLLWPDSATAMLCHPAVGIDNIATLLTTGALLLALHDPR